MEEQTQEKQMNKEKVCQRIKNLEIEIEKHMKNDRMLQAVYAVLYTLRACVMFDCVSMLWTHLQPIAVKEREDLKITDNNN